MQMPACCPAHTRFFMELKLELIPVPVADIDRAKAFYTEQVGFRLDHNVRPSATVRVVQLTPPGSVCSIVLGEGMGGIVMAPGSLRGLHLVVANIATARAELAGRGDGSHSGPGQYQICRFRRPGRQHLDLAGNCRAAVK